MTFYADSMLLIHCIGSICMSSWYISPFWAYRLVELLFSYYGNRAKIPLDPSMETATRPSVNTNSDANWTCEVGTL
jgi:hypothetical protein